MPVHWWTIAFHILHSALFLETWRDLWTLGWIMWGDVTILYCSGWWELEAHGHVEKLFSENEQRWRIMWWTLGTEINYGLKQLGHSLFLMELGPHLGLEIVVMYVPPVENSSALCYEMNSWAEGKVGATHHAEFGRGCFPCSYFLIYNTLEKGPEN